MSAERGVYFDAWFPRQHCYHPSLPARRLRMLDDLLELRATMLVWSALGGGSISLPYLEQEAFGPIEPRFRFYGFVNDSEFIAACRAKGIKVFGIVFEVQGWEFPAELNEEEDSVLALNELRGTGTRGWLGLREFSSGRYPKLWEPLEHYFPEGLRNSAGEPVIDLLEECCSRDIHGQPCHAHWVECPDRDHFCYAMDRNNPVWREYLKAVIRLQIDAGVDGVQLDEAELPITSMQYGGCFCKDCMEGFRDYLLAHPEIADIPQEDRATFHYGDFLLARGYDFKEDQSRAPLFLDYLRYQREQITRYFKELADYARDYGRARGRDVLVSGNFFNLQDHYYALEPSVDVIVTEMRNTTYRQPSWYRYAAGFAGKKPVVVVENPYGGVVPGLVRDLSEGRSYDRFRLSVFEAAALGANMTIPYGAWLGSVEQDSFWPPHDLCVEIQTWLADHERLFSRASAASTAVIFSVESNFMLETRDPSLANNTLNLIADEKLPFWRICDVLSDGLQPYDVVMFPDGRLRSDGVTVADLARYSTVVLPHCHVLTTHQATVLREYLDGGGRVVHTGPLAENLEPALASILRDHRGMVTLDDDEPGLDELLDARQIRSAEAPNAALNLQRVADGVAVHLIRYDYDALADEVPMLDELTLSVELDHPFDEATAFGAPRAPGVRLRRTGNSHELTLRDVPLYCVVALGRVGGRDVDH